MPIESWTRDGWLHLPVFFASDAISRVNELVDQLWSARPRNITVDDVDRGQRCRMSELDDSARPHRIKINDLYLIAPAIREVLLDARLVAIVRDLLADEPVLCNSLNLEHSSAQEYHADSLYMTPGSPDGLIACWIALEDVTPGSGPLRLYPASHRIAPFVFSDGSVHAHPGEMTQWAAYMQREIDTRQLEPVSVHAKAGDVVIWHADLLHGAEPITDASLTRKSLVAHYYRRADCIRLGFALAQQQGSLWMRRRPQPVDTATRVLSAIERRMQRLRALRHQLAIFRV